jgi:phosphoribosylformylglycinamidine synthase subunit PurL
VVLVAGDGQARLDASAYLGRAEGHPALPEIDAEVALIDFVRGAAEAGLLESAHDVSTGGIAVTLIESALAGDLGASVTLAAGRRADEDLFGEGGGRVVVTCRPEVEADLIARARGVALVRVGTVGGSRVEVQLGATQVYLELDDARTAYESALPEAVSR